MNKPWALAWLPVWLLTWLLALALASSCGPAAADNLLDVYAQARAADPLLAAAGARRGVQQELATQAGAALLPQWQVSAVDSRAQTDGSSSRHVESSISQVLVDIGRLRNRDAEVTQTSSQDALLRAAEQDLCARVARAYFGVLSAQAALATAQANEEALSTHAAQSRQRFDAGLVAQVDVEQGLAYHALARGSSLQAAQNLADAKEALAQITGRPAGTLWALVADLPALPPDPPSPQAWVDQALLANPALQAQALGLQASQQRIDAARAAHWPTLTAGLDTQRSDGGVASGRSQTQLAVRLSIPLFAGGATQSQVRQAAYQRDVVREGLLAAQRALTRETMAQHQAVLSSLALMDSTSAAVAAADRALAATRTGQNLGTRSNTDLLLAIQTQASAQNAHQQARHAHVLARLLLQQAAGQLGEAELAAVNQLLVAPAMPATPTALGAPSSKTGDS